MIEEIKKQAQDIELFKRRLDDINHLLLFAPDNYTTKEIYFVEVAKTLLDEVERLTEENKILEIKNRSSLANNLCPDHRDKQSGKECLACENETLKRKLDRTIDDWLREREENIEVFKALRHIRAIISPNLIGYKGKEECKRIDDIISEKILLGRFRQALFGLQPFSQENEIARRDFERKIYEECDKEDADEGEK